MGKRKVNSITYGALICALVGVLLMVNRYVLVGALDVYLFWIIPLPVIVYGQKFDTKQALIMCAAMVLMSFVLTTPAVVFYVFVSCLAGLVYNDGLAKNRSAMQLICSVIVISLATEFLTIFVFASFFGYDLAEEISIYQEVFQPYVDSYGSSASYLTSSNFLMTLIVISTAVTSVLEGVLVHLLAFMTLKKLKMKLPPMRPITELTTPGWMKLYIFSAIFAEIVSVAMQYNAYDEYLVPAMVIAQMFCIVYGYIYAIGVLSVKVTDPKKRKGMTVLLIISVFLLYTVYVALGIYDIYFGKRQKLIKGMKNSETQE